jgi:hypothetical protein
MRDDVKREVELVLARRALSWGLVGSVLSTLLPIFELFGDGRPRIVLFAMANTIIQWVLYFVQRRKYQAAAEEASHLDATEQPRGFLASRR